MNESNFITGTISGAPTFQFTRSIACEFTPQTDITAYELAQLLPYLHGKQLYEKEWGELGAATRHLKRTPR